MQNSTVRRQGINESLQVLRRGSHQTCIISIDQFPQPHVLNLYSSIRSHGLQVVIQAMNEQAKHGSTERQPCRNPIEGVLPSPQKPQTLMDNRQLSYKDCTAPNILPCAPSRWRRSHNNGHCTRSYADFRSTKQRYKGVSRHLCLSKTCCRTNA